MADDWKNKLYFGDNLNMLRDYVSDESVDLIYLDPPFNSNATYNVLFKEKSGENSAAQITAFEDTWHWSEDVEYAYQEIVRDSPKKLADLIQAFRMFLGQNDMMAYLIMMAQRMSELHRVLKPTGSIYLHCDPTASHYLKLLLDAVFGHDNFRSEIIWRRTNSHNKLNRQYGPIHDTILFYSKSEVFKFHPGYIPYSKAYIQDRFKYNDTHGIYQTNYLTGPGTRKGDSGRPWRGFDPTTAGRHWAIPKSLREFLPENGAGMASHEQLEALYKQDLILFPKLEGGQPMYKQYLGPGVPYQDIWAYQPNTKGVLFDSDQCIDEDVKYLEAEEQKLGYPTQKPEGLLERMMITSSDDDDLILDPFCGCGTAIAVAERLHRRWIGIDITHLAITLMRHRLSNAFGKDLSPYEIIGQPEDLESAKALAQESEHSGRYQFEWWSLGLVDARPAQDKKKGSDKGVDGYINFFDDNSGKAKTIIVQVKSGHVNASHIRDIKGVLEREKAQIGVYITLEEPTKPMKEEAATASFYEPEHFPGTYYPKVQILTIQDLLNGKTVDYPRHAPVATFKKAQRVRKTNDDEQNRLM